MLDKIDSTLQDVIEDVAAYILELRNGKSGEDGPATKRRKLNGESQANSKGAGAGHDAATLNAPWSSKTFEGISFSVPQRKKLSLEISPNLSEGIRAVNPSTQETEFGIPWKEIGQSDNQITLK